MVTYMMKIHVPFSRVLSNLWVLRFAGAVGGPTRECGPEQVIYLVKGTDRAATLV